MSKFARFLAVLLLLLSAAAEATAQTAPPRELRELLATVADDATLRLRLAAGEPVIGQASRVENDTLLVNTGGTAPTRVALADIVEVGVMRQSVREGASWGATIGATAFGTLGALFGLAIAYWDDDDSGVGPVIGGGLVGVAIGAALGSGVGAGIGAMARPGAGAWPAAPPRQERRTRVSLEAGRAFGRDLVEGGDGVSARLSVLKRTSRYLELGPVAEYHDVEGYKLVDTPWGTYAESASLSLGAGFDVRVGSGSRGLRPYVDSGLAWRAQDGLHLGSHVGGGLRWRGDGTAGVSLAVRHHFLVTHSDEVSPPFWSVTAGIVLGR